MNIVFLNTLEKEAGDHQVLLRASVHWGRTRHLECLLE